MITVAPSILSADFAYLADQVAKVEKAGADMLHIDVMDGHFVPNLTIGPQVVKNLNSKSQLFFDVHLMIEKPENMIQAFYNAGADLITVHAEACHHLHRVVHSIKDLGIQVGVALNPSTSVSALQYVAADIDVVLIMSVNPGFGGQKFIPGTVQKIHHIKELLRSVESRAKIEVDGGINEDTAYQVVKAGADILVAGSFVFHSPDPEKAIGYLKAIDETIVGG